MNEWRVEALALEGVKIFGTYLKDAAPFVLMAFTSATSSVLGGILLLLLLK